MGTCRSLGGAALWLHLKGSSTPPRSPILLPASRVHISGVVRLGFRLDGEIDVAGERFFSIGLTATKLGASACDGASSL